MPTIRKDDLPSYIQQQAYMGSLLGDGSLSKPPKGVNYHFGLYHAEKQREYLEWKHQLFTLYARPIQHCAYLDKRDGKVRTGYRFHTITHPYFTELRQMVYDGKRKTITANFLNRIQHPIALAILIGDDGSGLNNSHGRTCGVHIATKDFSKTENAMIAFWLQTTYGLVTAKLIPSHYPFIAIGVGDMPRLRSLIQPYLPVTMHYRLGGESWQPHKWVGKIKTSCEYCGKPMLVYASANQHYCSWQCSANDKRGKPTYPCSEQRKQFMRDWWAIHREEQRIKISISKRKSFGHAFTP